MGITDLASLISSLATFIAALAAMKAISKWRIESLDKERIEAVSSLVESSHKISKHIRDLYMDSLLFSCVPYDFHDGMMAEGDVEVIKNKGVMKNLYLTKKYYVDKIWGECECIGDIVSRAQALNGRRFDFYSEYYLSLGEEMKALLSSAWRSILISKEDFGEFRGRGAIFDSAVDRQVNALGKDFIASISFLNKNDEWFSFFKDVDNNIERVSGKVEELVKLEKRSRYSSFPRMLACRFSIFLNKLDLKREVVFFDGDKGLCFGTGGKLEWVNAGDMYKHKFLRKTK